MKRWLVIYRKEFTQSVTRPAERFGTKEEAEEVARDFNRFSQDQTWNAEVAIVHDSREKLRA